MNSQPKLSPDKLFMLVVFLLARYCAVVREKSDAIEMRAVATVFNVMQLFGVNVPTDDTFMHRYWTTLGPVIYAPVGRGQYDQHARVIAHEITHVVQFWRDGLGFIARYCTSKGRAELEAEAERAAIEAWWLLTGTLPEGIDALAITRHGYALDESHARLTADLLETACVSVSQGIISTDVGIEVLTWLKQHAPDAIVGHVHEVKSS